MRETFSPIPVQADNFFELRLPMLTAKAELDNACWKEGTRAVLESPLQFFRFQTEPGAGILILEVRVMRVWRMVFLRTGILLLGSPLYGEGPGESEIIDARAEVAEWFCR